MGAFHVLLKVFWILSYKWPLYKLDLHALLTNLICMHCLQRLRAQGNTSIRSFVMLLYGAHRVAYYLMV